MLLGEVYAHGLLQLLDSDDVEVALFGPVEDVLQDGSAADEVALRLALPREAAFATVETVLLLQCELLVEDAPVLVADGAQRTFESQREALGSTLARVRRCCVATRCTSSSMSSSECAPWIMASDEIGSWGSRTLFQRGHLLHQLGDMQAVTDAVAGRDSLQYGAHGIAVARGARHLPLRDARWHRRSGRVRRALAARVTATAVAARSRRCCAGLESCREVQRWCPREARCWHVRRRSRVLVALHEEARVVRCDLGLGCRDARLRIRQPAVVLHEAQVRDVHLVGQEVVVGDNLVDCRDLVLHVADGHEHLGGERDDCSADLRDSLPRSLELLHKVAYLANLSVDELLDGLAFSRAVRLEALEVLLNLGLVGPQLLHVALDLDEHPVGLGELLVELRADAARHEGCHARGDLGQDALLQARRLLAPREVHLDRLGLQVEPLVALFAQGGVHDLDRRRNVLEVLVVVVALLLQGHDAVVGVGDRGHDDLVLANLHALCCWGRSALGRPLAQAPSDIRRRRSRVAEVVETLRRAAAADLEDTELAAPLAGLAARGRAPPGRHPGTIGAGRR